MLRVRGNRGEDASHVWGTSRVSPRAHIVEHPLRCPPANSPASQSGITGFRGRRRSRREGHRLHRTRAKTSTLSAESQ